MKHRVDGPRIRIKGFKYSAPGLRDDEIEKFYAAIDAIRKKRDAPTPQSIARMLEATTDPGQRHAELWK